MEPLLVVAYTAAFLFLLRKLSFFHLPAIPISWLQLAFVLKVLGGIALGLLYWEYYHDPSSSDTIKFFNDSKFIYDARFSQPFHFFKMLTGIDGNNPALRPYYAQMFAWLNTDVLFNDNKTIIRLNTVFRFFSCGYYYVHVVFINFLSFAGLVALFKALSTYCSGRHRLLFLLMFTVPSLAFWGSGVLKDGLLLFEVGFLILTFQRLLSGDYRIKTILVFGMSLMLLCFTKLYMIVSVFPGLIAWRLAKNSSNLRAFYRFVAVYTIFIIAGFNVFRVDDRFDLSAIIYYKQRNFITQVNDMKPGSMIEIPTLEYGFLPTLKSAPGAFFRTLWKPSLADNLSNKMVLLAALENTFLLLVLAGLLLFYRRKGLPQLLPIHFFSLFVILLIYTLIGITTPVLGAMVRYKIIALPFLLFLVISSCDSSRLPQQISWLKDPV